METTTLTLRQQLDEQLGLLDAAQLTQVLQLVNDLRQPPAPPNRWAHLAGLITPEDAEIMRQASQECRTIEPDTSPTW